LQSGEQDASGARVFTASSFSIGNGHTVTINGSASDYVVIDITGNSGNKLDGALTTHGRHYL
jgi:filamentous hemagglutinin family protein